MPLQSLLHFLLQPLIMLHHPKLRHINPLEQLRGPLAWLLANTAIIGLDHAVEKVLDAR
jgi:hypothetical protein